MLQYFFTFINLVQNGQIQNLTYFSRCLSIFVQKVCTLCNIVLHTTCNTKLFLLIIFTVFTSNTISLLSESSFCNSSPSIFKAPVFFQRLTSITCHFPSLYCCVPDVRDFNPFPTLYCNVNHQ